MEFIVKWYDHGELMDCARVSYFHAVRLLKGEGVEESAASLALDNGIGLDLFTSDGYLMTFEKVE